MIGTGIGKNSFCTHLGLMLCFAWAIHAQDPPLYGYGPSNGDSSLAKTNDFAQRLDLEKAFPFGGKNHSTLYISDNGVISFDDAVFVESTETINRNIPYYYDTDGDGEIEDPDSILPFWADTFIEGTNNGDVYYRVTDNDTATLDKATDDVRQHFRSNADFTAQVVIVVTWHEVSFFEYASNPDTDPRNTFQAVLIHDGQESFVFFIYKQIDWVVGTLMGGSATTGTYINTGLGIAVVGFLMDDGWNAYNMQYDQDILLTLQNNSNVEIDGVYAYKVDSNMLIEPGTAPSTVPTQEYTTATSTVPTQASTGVVSTTAPVTCPRPTFTNPYAIELNPDQPTYNVYYTTSLTCEEGHTPSGLPSNIYCSLDGTWSTDPTDGLCYAQCNTTELIADDDIKATNGTGILKTVFDHGTTADFECTDEGQFSGSNVATCNNGTLNYESEPSCLAYCPINLGELGDGLYYDNIADDPVINDNETDTLYYRDGNVITYRCLDGYEDHINCTSSDCTSTCDDGTWDPPSIPTCVEINECNSDPCLNNTTCIDLINEYTCQCSDGFNGTNCENNIDECSSDPCENDGTCNDLVNGFNCTCAPGYTGETCDLVITTSAMTTMIMTTDIMGSPGTTSEPNLMTDKEDLTTIELTTATSMSTTAMPDQNTIAATTTKAFTTEATSRSTSAGEVTTPVPEPPKTEPKTEPEKTTASPTRKPTTPEKTEKPPTTPLPCRGECLDTQVCNGDDECECRPDYYLDEDDIDTPCKEPTSIDVSIRITEANGKDAEYIEAYANQTSPEFKALEEDVCEPFNEIYSNETDYIGCRVLGCTNGSIIVDYALQFVENSKESASSVNETVYKELQNPNGSFSEFELDEKFIVVEPLDECKKHIDDCGPNAVCTDKGDKGYECACEEGFLDIGIPTLLPGRECLIIEATDPPTEPTTTEGPEPGPDVWKVVVGVTVPIVSILTITVISLICWKHRRLDRTTPTSGSITMKTYPYDNDSDREARPEGLQEVV